MSKHRPLFRFALAIGLICGVVRFSSLIRISSGSMCRIEQGVLAPLQSQSSEGISSMRFSTLTRCFHLQTASLCVSNQGKGAFRLRTFGKIYVDVSPLRRVEKATLLPILPRTLVLILMARSRANPWKSVLHQARSTCGPITTKPTAADLAELEKTRQHRTETCGIF